jgi:hypothetical protein
MTYKRNSSRGRKQYDFGTIYPYPFEMSIENGREARGKGGVPPGQGHWARGEGQRGLDFGDECKSIRIKDIRTQSQGVHVTVAALMHGRNACSGVSGLTLS